MDIKQKMHFQQNEVDVARLQCAIMAIGSEKILICSWHGPHTNQNDNNKKESLQNMLKFVDKIKVEKGCCAALIGGDFNLKSSSAKEVLRSDTIWPDKPKNAVLYDCYKKPLFRAHLIDYVIAWPSDKISQNSCRVIDTVPRQPKTRIFDHALIRYNFTVRLKGKWEGDGEVKWCGKCGEGKVTLRDNSIEEIGIVHVKGVESGKYEGFAQKGCCRNFEKLEIIVVRNMKYKIGGAGDWLELPENEGLPHTFSPSDGDEVQWKGRGRVKWESAGAIDVAIEGKGEQIVEWNGTGSVEWKGRGRASWIGGKLEKWEGNQIVKWADDQLVRWSGGGTVGFKGGELKNFSRKGNWVLLTESVFGVERSRKWSSSEKSAKLEWKGRGVIWKVAGTGTGEML